LPAGASYSFSSATLNAGTGAATVTLTIQLPQAQASAGPAAVRPNLQLDANSHGSGPGSVVGRLAPFALALVLLPFAGRMRRAAKRLGRIVSVLLLLAAGIATIAGVSGCGSTSGFFAQSQQSYTIQVTGTSGTLSHGTSFTLTVE
jgi:hypothetical protein